MHGNKQSALAQRLRALRQARNWTLKQAAAATGVAASTLSKIENSLLSPTYDNLIKIAAGLDLDVAELFSASDAHMGTGRRSLSREGEGRQYETPYYDHRLLCTALSHKRMMPFHTRVKARSFDEFQDWSRHRGEEFVYVLEGEVMLYTEFYEPARLKAGESFYIDSRMGHRVISLSEADAMVLWVSTHADIEDE
ncbi:MULTISPECIES: helix-turn-helix domain-containing protein [Achromobacter]|jgi:transcriptional regulator with XRE-family HTH domain|uniref:XRE family transcriptional regulator n=1 Tax=Achromobacter spanius TaxID=217203 RepID=A0AA42LPA1_9BURK|nr:MULTISPECIES: XRE family transcriptional regulator [Achromobacter]MCS3504387.1 transcriptional regulator with XRE-family HTH domain [Achromobacter sp. JUb104]MDH0737039.1 XRE family transcriptional regulator [Achromobacter spanius]WAI85760.1 XRE family transcriptional regulator [Achromobacter spanius]WEX95841.1 XRE family transcriptional regulator [Achromobacter sp. SS2-2022]WFP10438.1 XRE family transcriptional regulator [Achromobacter spanius]